MRYRIKGTRLYVKPMASADANPPAAYEAASVAPRVARWRWNAGGPNATLSASLATLRGRSRQARRSNGLADLMAETWVSNVVGAGIKPQFSTSDAGLNRDLAALWLKWTDEADADGRCDFYGLEALAAGAMFEAGDVFARLRARRPEDGLAVPLQLQLLESEFCPAETSRALANGGWIQNGIEFDAIGRRAAYWLYRSHPDDGGMRVTAGPGAPARFPAGEVIHLASAKRPGAVRGEPWLARALVKLHDLDEYDDAQLVRQKIAALFTGFITPGDAQPFALEGAVDAAGTGLVSLEPGMTQMLEAGQEIEWSKPPDPGQSYEAFNTQQHRYLAGSVGLLYEQVSGDYSKVNDRTWRAAVNEFLTRLERWQHHLLVFQFCRPAVRRWVELAVLAGAVRLPRQVSLDEAAMPKWLPPRRRYINPVQDVQARRDEVRAGFRSRGQMVSEDGYDVEAVDKEIAADNARADELGLVLDSDPRKTGGTGLTQARVKGAELPSVDLPGDGNGG